MKPQGSIYLIGSELRRLLEDEEAILVEVPYDRI
jgi:hypothetical protein